MPIHNIPLNQLTPCKANVGKTGRLTGIEELAANIQALGLLQNLQVRDTENGKYEVVAGRRRFAALKLLAKRKAIAKDADIPCKVLAEGESAVEVSLAENVMRLPMHPADQYEAFKALSDEGKGPEDIAARFGCAPSTVKQRLKLATVSPALLDAYREGEMNLDQLMAFAVSDDHGQQEKLWSELPQWNRNPETIRRALMAAHVEADDALAVFVGIEAYVAAGGAVLRDLFTPEHEGYLTDAALLDRLVREKLEGEAETIRAEGWKWVDIMPDIDQSAFRGFGRVYCVQEPLDAERQAEVDRMQARLDTLIAKEGSLTNEEEADLDALPEQIEGLSEGKWHFVADDMALAGCVVGIGYDGTLDMVRGLIRPEDMPEKEPKHRESSTTAKPKDPTALPAPVVQDLTAHRTAGLRAMMLANGDVALAAVVHALALPLFYQWGAKSCLDLTLKSEELSGSAEGIEGSSAAAKLAERYADLKARMPEAAEDLWGWLVERPMETHLDLLAYCAARSVNAVVKPHERADTRILHADELALALKLDMTEWWQPTGASYLGRVSKGRILEAVTEAVSPSAAENFLKLKKDALVKHAEERLQGTAWLPALLRTPVTPPLEPERATLAA